MAGSLLKGLWHPSALLPSGMFIPKLQAPACENEALVPECRLRLVSELPHELRGRPHFVADHRMQPLFSSNLRN